MPRNPDDGMPPPHLPPDLRTMMIAGDVAQSTVVAGHNVQAMLLGELVATLHDVGALPSGAVKGLAERWHAILSSLPGSPEFQRTGLLMAADLRAELAWALPGVAPASDTRPTRVGRKRTPPPRPDAGR